MEERGTQEIAVDFVTALRSLSSAMSMYPPGSRAIVIALEKCFGLLKRIIELQGALTLAEVDTKLVVDGRALGEKHAAREPVVEFIRFMMNRNLQSITIQSTITDRELVNFLTVVNKNSDQLKLDGPLPDQLSEKGISSIKINEKVYVATTKERAKLDKEKEEIFQRYLQGKLSITTINPGALTEILQQPGQLYAMLTDVVNLDEKPPEELEAFSKWVRVKVRESLDVVKKSFDVFSNVPDPGLRENLKLTATEIITSLDHNVIGNLIYEDQLGEQMLAKMGMYQNIYDRLPEGKTKKVAEYLVNEVNRLKGDVGGMDQEKKVKRAMAVKSLIAGMTKSLKGRDELYDDVIERFTKAGIFRQTQEETQDRKERRETRERQPQPAAGSDSSVINLVERLMTGDGQIDPAPFNQLIRMVPNIPQMDLMRTFSSLTQNIDALVQSDLTHGLVSQLAGRMRRETYHNEVFAKSARFIGTLFNRYTAGGNIGMAAFITEKVWEVKDDNQFAEEERDDMVKSMVKEVVSVAEDPGIAARIISGLGEDQGATANQNAKDVILRLRDVMVAPLIQRLKESQSREERMRTVEVLKEIGAAAHAKLLAELDDANPWFVLRNVVQILTEIGDPVFAKDIARFASHPEAKLRQEVLQSLIRLDREYATTALTDALKDPDRKIRLFAIGKLAEVSGDGSVDHLAALIRKSRSVLEPETDEIVQIEAINALTRIGGQKVVEILAETIKREGMFSNVRSKSTEVRKAAVLALVHLPAEQAAPILKQVAGDKEKEVKYAAASVARKLRLSI